MKYFFILGNNPTLSLAELNSVFNLEVIFWLSENVLIWDTNVEIDCVKLISQLGGLIKIGVIEKEINRDSLSQDITIIVNNEKEHSREGKFNFGISNYSYYSFDVKRLGLEIKKNFKEKNISSRFVVSRDKLLSSVVVTQNKLLSRGVEVTIFSDKKRFLLGKTIAVQDFKGLSKRDYGRPARDDKSGMLPPKLAQIMINLAQTHSKDSVIIDPFCGSGTVLTEALLLGYDNLIGSDISPEAVNNTRENINWIKEKYSLDKKNIKLFVKSAENLSMFIKNNSVSSIITEPYLGPQRGKIDFRGVINNLEILYSRVIKEFHKILEQEGRVVMIWPVFCGSKLIKPEIDGFKTINLLPRVVENNNFIKLSSRNTIIYGRSGQKVFREIIVLEKV